MRTVRIRIGLQWTKATCKNSRSQMHGFDERLTNADIYADRTKPKVGLEETRRPRVGLTATKTHIQVQAAHIATALDARQHLPALAASRSACHSEGCDEPGGSQGEVKVKRLPQPPKKSLETNATASLA